MPDPFSVTLREPIAARKARALWCVISAVVLQCGLLIYLPTQQQSVYWTIAAVVLSLFTGAWAVFAPAERLRGSPRPLLFAVFLACLTSLPSRSKTLIEFLGGAPPEWLLQALFALVLLAIGAIAWRGGRRAKTVLLLLLAAIFVYRARYAVRSVDEKEVDVVYFHHEGYKRFLHGGSPYAGPMPIYADPETARKIYPVEMLRGNSLEAGYTYPPVSFLLGLPSFLITGDFRYTGVAALLLTAFLITRFSPGEDGWLLAAILLTNPYSVLVVSFGWTETGTVLLLCLFLLGWRRWPARSAWLFGLFIASKQTMIVWIPLGLLLLADRFAGRRERLWWLGKCALMGVVPLVAFSLLGSPGELYESMIRYVALYPIRADSISIGTVLARSVPGARWVVPFLGAGLLSLILGCAIWRGLHRVLSMWVIAYALAWTAFLVVNKQALPNYYYFSAVIWCIGAALLGGDESGSGDGPEPIPTAMYAA